MKEYSQICINCKVKGLNIFGYSKCKFIFWPDVLVSSTMGFDVRIDDNMLADFVERIIKRRLLFPEIWELTKPLILFRNLNTRSHFQPTSYDRSKAIYYGGWPIRTSKTFDFLSLAPPMHQTSEEILTYCLCHLLIIVTRHITVVYKRYLFL